MKLTIECECGAIHHTKIKTTKEHAVETVCPFCGKTEIVEIEQ